MSTYAIYETLEVMGVDEDKDDIVFHYAVWKASYSSMVPACSRPQDLDYDWNHGITINRGDVNCFACLRMMYGDDVLSQWVQWDLENEERGIMIDGLFVPNHAMYAPRGGIRYPQPEREMNDGETS